MKKFILQFLLPLFIICGAILAIGNSCGGLGVPPTPPIVVTCDSVGTKFITLYNAYASTNQYSYDAQVYEYTFKTSVAGNICAIGYQGHPNLVSTNAYKIDIIETATGTVLNTGTYSFPGANRSYKALSTSLQIAANNSITIRRTVVNNLGNVANTVSNFKQIPNPFVPIVNGNLTIISTKTYDFYSGAQTNVTNNGVLGCIDFVLN